MRGAGISFHARDGSAAYFVRATKGGWSVARKTEPSCPPRAVRLARRYDTPHPPFACRRPHGLSIAMGGGDDSTLEALHWYISRNRSVAPPLRKPAGPYVFIGRERRHWYTFGHITSAGLRAHIRVFNDTRSEAAAAVDSVSWCAPGS